MNLYVQSEMELCGRCFYFKEFSFIISFEVELQ